MASFGTTSLAWSTTPGTAPLPGSHFAPHYPQPSSFHRLLHHHAVPPATPPLNSDTRLPFECMSSPAVAASSHRAPGYAAYLGSRGTGDAAHMRMHSLETGFYTSYLPVKRRTRQKTFSSEEARQAAKMLQKAKRREQNRNAQRRLRDRKEEHIFKLEGEVAQLRRQGEQQRSEVQGLEELIRRLLEQRQELQRRLDPLSVGSPSSANDLAEWSCTESARLAPLMSPRTQQLPRLSSKLGDAHESANALGLSEYEPPSSFSSAALSVGARSNSSASEVPRRESSMSSGGGVSSASSSSILTPRSPSCLNSTEPRPKSTSMHSTLLNARQPLSPSTYSSSQQLHLPRTKLDPQCAPLSLAPVSSHWGASH